MKLIKVEVRGHKRIAKKLERMRLNHLEMLAYNMDDALDMIAERANLNLIRSIGSYRTPRDYSGHGHPSIDHLADTKDDMTAWQKGFTKIRPGIVEKTLTNTCRHAAVVEFGYQGTIKPKGKFLLLGYKFGDRTSDPILVESVEGQKGYGFLQQALDNERLMKTIRRKMERDMYRRLIKL